MIFDAALFPRRVGMCEEYLGFKPFGDIPMLGELASVVSGYRADFPDVR